MEPASTAPSRESGGRSNLGGEVRITGRRLVVNGVSKIPLGLFGVHAVSLDAETCADWGVEGVRRIFALPPETKATCTSACTPAWSSRQPMPCRST